MSNTAFDLAFLNRCVQQAKAIPPGGRFSISTWELKDVCAPRGISAAEWILENIVGSAFEWRFWHDHNNRRIVFARLSEPLDPNSGLRTYVSPDRQFLYRLRPDLLYEPA